MTLDYAPERQAAPTVIADVMQRLGVRMSFAKGEEIFQTNCATCHGEFGEGKDRWPTLAGGLGSLTHDRPEKTIGSFWPYATIVFDYVKRAMPFGNAQSLSDDDIYAITAYLLQVNDVIKDPNFELNAKTILEIKMPNADGFYDDDRETAEKEFWTAKPCMTNCLPKEATITSHARILDVTPDKAADSAKKAPPVQ